MFPKMMTLSLNTQSQVQNQNSGTTSTTNPENHQVSFEWKEEGVQSSTVLP